MPDNVANNTDQHDYSSVARKQLIRALLKAVPYIGSLIDDMSFGVLEKEAGKRDKEKLDEAIESIRKQQAASATDLGDVLLRLDQARLESHEVKNALRQLSAFLTGETADADEKLIVAAMQRTVPPEFVETSNQPFDSDGDSEILRKAMRDQLTPAMLQAVVRDYLTARDWINLDLARVPMVSQLVEWAKSADGEGIGSLVAYIKRQHPNFKLNPH